MTSPISAGRRLAAWAVVLTAMATMAACRGSAPEQQEQQQPQQTIQIERPQSATPLTVVWTDADIEKDASRVGYGSHPDAILARSSDGSLIFTPETANDHVATQFTGLGEYDGARSLELSLETKTAGGETCVANLQDQAFNVLATVPCRTPGEQRATANVPPSVVGVRVYFLSETRERMRLPDRMTLTEHR